MVSENGGVELVVTCGVCGRELGRSEGDVASVPHGVCDCAPPQLMGRGEPLEGDFSPKAVAFLRELAELCVRHKVTLSTSGYDGMQVWDMEDPSEVLHCAGVEDRTTP